MSLNNIKDEKQQIIEIMNDIFCQNNYQCYKNGIENFQKIGDILAKDIIECKSSGSNSCPHSLSYGDTYFCKCPLLNYLFLNKK